MILSDYFSLEEFTASEMARARGIKNTPGDAEIANMKALCENVLVPLRRHFGNKAVKILSGYRSPALNKAVKGAPASQHISGQAADIRVIGVPNVTVWLWIKDNTDFDQVIAEKLSRYDGAAGWVHVSYDAKKARKDALSFNGKQYLKGLHYVD